MAVSDEMNSVVRKHTETRSGVAFLIEALVVLAFLMFALAVFVQLFSKAQLEGLRAKQLSEAVQVATVRAEEFSANPKGTSGTTAEGDYTVTCDVVPTPHAGGTLYDATIRVRKDDTQLYELKTSRYVSGNQGGDAA